jgi:hypothetical protein
VLARRNKVIGHGGVGGYFLGDCGVKMVQIWRCLNCNVVGALRRVNAKEKRFVPNCKAEIPEKRTSRDY